MKLLFKREKETKNTIRYAEEQNGQPPVLKTVYVQKWFAKNAPALSIDVEPVNE